MKTRDARLFVVCGLMAASTTTSLSVNAADALSYGLTVKDVTSTGTLSPKSRGVTR